MATPGAPRLTILIVDDDEILVDLLSAFLRRADYLVASASNGHEALACFEQSPSSFGLLVSDVEMPGLSGIELARKVAAAGCPVLLMSGRRVSPEEMEPGWQFLAKPFVPSVLVHTVGQILGDNSNMRAYRCG